MKSVKAPLGEGLFVCFIEKRNNLLLYNKYILRNSLPD